KEKQYKRIWSASPSRNKVSQSSVSEGKRKRCSLQRSFLNCIIVAADLLLRNQSRMQKEHGRIPFDHVQTRRQSVTLRTQLQLEYSSLPDDPARLSTPTS